MFTFISIVLFVKVDKQNLEIRSCQDHLSIEHSKNSSNEHEQQQLRHCLQTSNEQIEKYRQNLNEKQEKLIEYERTIDELNSRNYLFENKFIETMSILDLRNQTIIDYEQQVNKFQIDLLQKHKDLLEKQNLIDQLEQDLIEKSARIAQLTETFETEQIKNQQREKSQEDYANQTQADCQNLQRDVTQNSISI